MNETTKHAPGTFCWPELSTSDPAAAKKFYGGLFGWTAKDDQVSPDMVYTMFQLEGKELAAAHALMPEQKKMGIPPHWLSYISVDNVDDALSKVTSLGGKVGAGPFDVMDAGRMGVAFDPVGAAFGLWQPKKHIGARLVDQPGTLVWTELLSSNVDVTGKFYSNLFDWGQQLNEVGPMKYTVFMRGDKPAGGMMQISPDMGKVPPNWMPYFGVTDPDGTAANTTKLGGKVAMPPADIPNVGRFAVLQDPQGATFGIIRFLPRSQ